MKFLIIFSLFTFYTCSQNHLKSIPTSQNISYQGAETKTEAICRLEKIENSKNKIEIRLIQEPTMIAFYDVFILSLNEKGWKAIRYVSSPGLGHYDSTHPIKTFYPKHGFNAEKLFDILKENNIFLLPNQKDINIQSNFSVDDGAEYSIRFKNDTFFGKYDFNNPDIYKEHFTQVKEFGFYSNIVNTFYSFFEKYPF